MIDYRDPTPLYQQVAAILRQRIDRGEIAPDKPLPSAVRLAGEFGVARGTAVRALQLLVEEGRAYVRMGKGTYVIDPNDTGTAP